MTPDVRAPSYRDAACDGGGGRGARLRIPAFVHRYSHISRRRLRPLLPEAGKAPRRGGWGRESRQLRGDSPSIQPAPDAQADSHRSSGPPPGPGRAPERRTVHGPRPRPYLPSRRAACPLHHPSGGPPPPFRFASRGRKAPAAPMSSPAKRGRGTMRSMVEGVRHGELGSHRARKISRMPLETLKTGSGTAPIFNRLLAVPKRRLPVDARRTPRNSHHPSGAEGLPCEAREENLVQHGGGTWERQSPQSPGKSGACRWKGSKPARRWREPGASRPPAPKNKCGPERFAARPVLSQRG